MTTLAVKFIDGQVAEYPLPPGFSAVKGLITPSQGDVDEPSLAVMDADNGVELLPLEDIEMFEVMT